MFLLLIDGSNSSKSLREKFCNFRIHHYWFQMHFSNLHSLYRKFKEELKDFIINRAVLPVRIDKIDIHFKLSSCWISHAYASPFIQAYHTQIISLLVIHSCLCTTVYIYHSHNKFFYPDLLVIPTSENSLALIQLLNIISG